MDQIDIGALVADEATADAVRAVLERWFEVVAVSRPDRRLPLHVVGCQPWGQLTRRDLAAIALRTYAAGASEAWVVPSTSGQSGRLLPRVVAA
jgi:hypothetical protein